MDLGGGYRGGAGGGREEAERWLSVAERLLGARDLAGSKRFAERAMEAEPLLDGVDQVLAVTDVILAGQRRINNHVDWYAVLQLPPPSSSSADGGDPADVKRQYRRLALLLHPDHNRSPGADAAYSLVADAFVVLSDPAKKSLFDAEIRIASAAAAASKPSSSASVSAAGPFWTTCPTCCHLHLFAGEYLNLSLRCPTCSRPFLATEISSPPSVVPGTDTYYCSWVFFPLGFPGGPSFGGSGGIAPPGPDSEWKPFYPMFPNWGSNNTTQSPCQQPGTSVQPPDGRRESQNSGKKDIAVEAQWVPPARNKKTMAQKKVGGGLTKGPLSSGNNGKGTWRSGIATPGPAAQMGSGMKPINLEEEAEEEVVRGININEEYKSFDSGAEEQHVDDSLSFHIDVDATDEILGNLHNLPFLKEEEIPLQMP